MVAAVVAVGTDAAGAGRSLPVARAGDNGDDARMQPDLAQRIGELVVQGDRIRAIQLLREATGMGLAEAKTVIDAVAAGGNLPPLAAQQAAVRAADPDGEALSAEVRRLAAAGNRIGAIRLLREERGLGLQEAKDLLDRAVPVAGGAAAAARRGCLLPLLGVVLFGGLGWLCG